MDTEVEVVWMIEQGKLTLPANMIDFADMGSDQD